MKDTEHKRDYYTCKRLRLLQYLKESGFTPYATIPDPTNVRFSWWLFDNTPDLQKCVDKYFKELKEKQQFIHKY